MMCRKPMTKNKQSIVLAFAAVLLLASSVESFMVPSLQNQGYYRSVSSSSKLSFGLPSWFTTPESIDDDTKTTNKKGSSSSSLVPEPKIGMSGVIQLITAGLGAPFLGDFEGVDKETGKFMFSLEANNLVDEDGNSKQTSMPYFESGWVDPEDEKRAQAGGGAFKFPWQ